MLDIDKAVAAEVSVEYWGGHIGTSSQRFQINDGTWFEIPQPQGTPTEPQRFYRTLLGNNRTPIPIESLKQGSNILRFEAGKQIAYGFDFGFYWIYDFTVRVFFSDDHPHPTGNVATIDGQSSFDDTLELELKPGASPNGKVVRVDFIGEYDDFDWDGDGIWREYQFTSHHGRLRHHLGTATEFPWQIQWDARWIPDQSAPTKVRAIITDELGVSYLTAPIEVRQIRSHRKVKMIKPKSVPEKFASRDSKESADCLIDVTDELAKVTAAKLRLSTWSANVDDDSQHELRLNGKKLADRFGVFHNYSFDTLDVPIDLLLPGINKVTLYSTFKGHSLEVNWPGPVLLLEFQSKE
jgi:hypothetical protein